MIEKKKHKRKIPNESQPTVNRNLQVSSNNSVRTDFVRRLKLRASAPREFFLSLWSVLRYGASTSKYVCYDGLYIQQDWHRKTLFVLLPLLQCKMYPLLWAARSNSILSSSIPLLLPFIKGEGYTHGLKYTFSPLYYRRQKPRRYSCRWNSIPLSKHSVIVELINGNFPSHLSHFKLLANSWMAVWASYTKEE